MQTILYGNSFTVQWDITFNGQPADFAGMKLAVLLSDPEDEIVPVHNVRIQPGTITFDVYAIDCNIPEGNYSANLFSDLGGANQRRILRTNVVRMVNNERDLPAPSPEDVTIETNIPFGSRGYSAYEIACQEGFVGTVDEWLQSLHGKDGYTPQKGIDYFDGNDGYTPVKGKDYNDGADGAPGRDGRDGHPIYMAFRLDPHNMHLYASEDCNRISISKSKHLQVKF